MRTYKDYCVSPTYSDVMTQWLSKKAPLVLRSVDLGRLQALPRRLQLEPLLAMREQLPRKRRAGPAAPRPAMRMPQAVSVTCQPHSLDAITPL